MSTLKEMLLLQASNSLPDESDDDSSDDPPKATPKKKKVAAEKIAKHIGKQIWTKAYHRLMDENTEYAGVFTTADFKDFAPFGRMRKCVEKYEFTAHKLARKTKENDPDFCLEKDCSALLRKPAVTNGLLSLVDIMSSAIITAGMTANKDASGVFNDPDINMTVSVFFGKYLHRHLRFSIAFCFSYLLEECITEDTTVKMDSIFFLMKRIIDKFDGKKQAGPDNLFPDWMKVLRKDSRFKQVTKKGFAFSDTDGIKVILMGIFITHHLMSEQPSGTHFNNMIKLIQATRPQNTSGFKMPLA
jgi:hypothetical protein